MKWVEALKLWFLISFLVAIYTIGWIILSPPSRDFLEPFLWVPALFFYGEFLVFRILSTKAFKSSAEDWLQSSVKAVVFKIQNCKLT